MKFETGYMIADLALQRTSSHREVAPGELVFAEGDPASGLFIVLSGKIEISGASAEGEVKLAEVAPGGIFGEMGLISEEGRRVATARAAEPSLLLEVGGNPIQLLRDLGEPGGAVALLKQVVCILAEWLRSKAPAGEGGGQPDAKAAGIIESHLPRRSFWRAAPRLRLEDGQYLCRQGERSNGFYFIHSGAVEVLQGDGPEGGEAKAGEMRGPTVAGEIGYFSGERRLASLRARGEVIYSVFSGDEFEELEETKPDKAIEVLIAAARSIVALVR